MAQIAIVTGGSQGFGRAVSVALVREGWTVLVDGRDAAALEAAVAATGALAVPGDLNDAAHRAELVARAADLGGLDLLVNSAGTLGPSPLPKLGAYPLAGLREVLETNVVAQLGLVQAALPLLREAAGAVVNITSDAAVEAYEGWGGYGASKAALEQMSRVLAAEEPAVRVWWADPGDMRTRMHQDAFPGEDIGDRPGPDEVAPALVELVATRPPSGRIALRGLLPPAGSVRHEDERHEMAGDQR